VARVEHVEKQQGDGVASDRKSTAVLVSVLMSGEDTESGSKVTAGGEESHKGKVKMIQVMNKIDTLGTKRVKLTGLPPFTAAADASTLSVKVTVTQGAAEGALYAAVDIGDTVAIVTMDAGSEPFTAGGGNVVIGGANVGPPTTVLSDADWTDYGFKAGDRVVITDELFDTNFHITIRRLSSGNATKLNGLGSNGFSSLAMLGTAAGYTGGHISDLASIGQDTESYNIHKWEDGVFTGVVLKSNSYSGVDATAEPDTTCAKAILTVRKGTLAGDVDNLTFHPQNDGLDGVRNVWDPLSTSVHSHSEWGGNGKGFGKTGYYTFSEYLSAYTSPATGAEDTESKIPFKTDKNYHVDLVSMFGSPTSTPLAGEPSLATTNRSKTCKLAWSNADTVGDRLNSIQAFMLSNRLTPVGKNGALGENKSTVDSANTTAVTNRNETGVNAPETPPTAAAEALWRNKLSAEIPIETGDVFVVLGTIGIDNNQKRMDGSDIDGDEEGSSTMEMHFTVRETVNDST
jgi:hypothetical protein